MKEQVLLCSTLTEMIFVAEKYQLEVDGTLWRIDSEKLSR